MVVKGMMVECRLNVFRSDEEGMKRAHFKGMVKNWQWTKPERLSRRARQQAASAPQWN